MGNVIMLRPKQQVINHGGRYHIIITEDQRYILERALLAYFGRSEEQEELEILCEIIQDLSNHEEE